MKLRKNYICSDPKILKEIFEKKQFDNFPERNMKSDVPANELHLFLATGERWINLRKNASIFTNKNIQSMNPLIEYSIKDVLNEMKIGSNKCEIVDFNNYSDLLFASLISRIAFSTAFPNIPLNKFKQKYVNFSKDLINKKEKHKENKNQKQQFGLFNILYNYILMDEKELNEEINEESTFNSTTRLEVIFGRLLINNSVKAAGLQTIGFALSCIAHFIAHCPFYCPSCIAHCHLRVSCPQIQETLRTELINLQNENNNLFLKETSEKLLDAVINETLRLFPIVAFANTRTCNIKYNVENGDICLNPGDTIEADIFSIARNKEFWGVDANEFKPERWFNLPHSPSSFLALLPFGYGPRRCIGISIAKHILKKTLTAIILKFKIFYENTNKIEQCELIGKEVLKPKNVFVRIEEVKNIDA